jgi:hypothetical protein
MKIDQRLLIHFRSSHFYIRIVINLCCYLSSDNTEKPLEVQEYFLGSFTLKALEVQDYREMIQTVVNVRTEIQRLD